MEMTEKIEETAREIGARVRPQIEEAKRRFDVANDSADRLHQGKPGEVSGRRHRGRLPHRQDCR